ncbi:MAG: DUF4398 domain-containing protein, partial [Steroidobacteraceae bacterium]
MARNPFVMSMAIVVLAACASKPERFEPLEEARAAVQSAAQDPLVQQVASEHVQRARSALAAAERAHEEKKSRDEVAHLAYVAGRHAQIANAFADEHRARELVARGEAERNRVLLEARTLEADRAT